MFDANSRSPLFSKTQVCVPKGRARSAVRHNDPCASARLTMATRASSRARRLLGALGAAHAPVPQVRACLSRRRPPEISRAPQRPDEFFGRIETSRAKRPAESSASDVYARARVPTTAPPRRPPSARATSRPPPSPRATPQGASPSPFSDAHRLARAGRRGFVSRKSPFVFPSERDVERAAAPSRIPLV